MRELSIPLERENIQQEEVMNNCELMKCSECGKKDFCVSEDMLKRAEINTAAQLTAGDGCFADYTDVPLLSRAEDPLGDMEFSFDGVSVLVETEPSTLPIHLRWGRRIEKKFKVPRKAAILFSYMLYAQLDGENREVRSYYEQQIAERGIEAVASEVRALFFEMLHLEPGDETRAFIGEGAEFRALPVDVQMWDQENPEHVPSEKEAKSVETYYSIVAKIRRLGKKKIAEAGKKLFAWSKRDDVRAMLGYETIKMIWGEYNARKQQLAGFVPSS